MTETRKIRRSRQRERLILALLQQPGLEKAAAAIGVSYTTAWRMTKTAEFQEEYRRARRDAFAQSMGRLQQAAGAATSTLLKIMVDSAAPSGSRVRAADRILRHAAHALELEDTDIRLTRLEQIAKEEELEEK